MNMHRHPFRRPLLLSLAAGWLLFAAHTGVADETPTAVDFTLATLDGGDLSVADLRGRWVVLNYWATWCGPCRKEIPDLSQLHDRNERVTVLGLAYEEATEEEFRAFLEEYRATYPILLVDVFDPPQPFGAPKVLPTTIVLDPSGVPRETWVGPVTGAQIEAFIEDSESS